MPTGYSSCEERSVTRLHDIWVGDIGFGSNKTEMGDINVKET